MGIIIAQEQLEKVDTECILKKTGQYDFLPSTPGEEK